MFVRRLKSKNGKTYVQVVDKSSGRYKVIESFGGANTKIDEENLINKANNWIREKSGLTEFDFSDVDSLFESFIISITLIKRVGYDLPLEGSLRRLGLIKLKMFCSGSCQSTATATVTPYARYIISSKVPTARSVP